MPSREEIEALRDNYARMRDKLIAQVNLMQGAYDGISAVLALYDAQKAVEDAGAKLEGAENGSA